MNHSIPISKYINQVIIKGLWNRFDVNWTLNCFLFKKIIADIKNSFSVS
jgi:hypothetical protein